MLPPSLCLVTCEVPTPHSARLSRPALQGEQHLQAKQQHRGIHSEESQNRAGNIVFHLHVR